ncbi:flagellar hook-associated protein FlgK [Pseudobdellovibrio exovorus]|uniref:Flagellar hook-associated protein 1 n=1 Tax=Pseudobdellovibrio exovorus JSS TaxID=1184267 RepID=M4V9T5_9BACT|nr:flagellar hook-associated protein FlgK [Pseudobdellovibrio exovorus]AGH94791.1 FlgK, flagellar hook-associated protein [Pseudobdellovibrio exovorus JSS]
MAKIHGLLDVGRRGMAVSQAALNTTSHNIANKSTEGYSRQRVETQTSPAVDAGNQRIGTGASLKSINRTNNPWLEKQLEREGSNLAFLEGRSGALNRLESAFNEQTVKGLSGSMSDFFNSFRELANNPESLTARTVVRDKAAALVQTFQDVDRQIESVNSELNNTIETGINEVNTYSKEIAKLNEKIQSIEVAGNSANDERDRRDLLVKKLSEKLDISYAEDTKSGMINITSGKTGILVAGTSSASLKVGKDAAGQIAVLYPMSEKGTQVNITEQFKRGSMGGALELRDGSVSEIRAQLADLAYNLAAEVNEAHSEGYDRYSQKGMQFFSLPQDGSFDLSSLRVNEQISNDVGRIAAGAKPNAPGDNTTANVIHSLQFKHVMGADRTFTFDNFFNSKVGEIGTMNQTARANLESQKNIHDQLKNVRESISGVSLDEEAQKMIEFQKSYEASARVIRMADEMFETVLSLKRL